MDPADPLELSQINSEGIVHGWVLKGLKQFSSFSGGSACVFPPTFCNNFMNLVVTTEFQC